MAESNQKKLSRIRKPRVHITYDVETEGAEVEKELPFVVGVMGDFSGNPTQKLAPLADRKFIQIDRDNFNDVMKRMTPGLNIRVENTMKGDGSEMGVDLKFDSMEDFDPAKVAEQVEPIKKLMDTRNKLRDLMTKVDRSDELGELLEQALGDDEQLKKLADQLGVSSDSSDEGGE